MNPLHIIGLNFLSFWQFCVTCGTRRSGPHDGLILTRPQHSSCLLAWREKTPFCFQWTFNAYSSYWPLIYDCLVWLQYNLLYLPYYFIIYRHFTLPLWLWCIQTPRQSRSPSPQPFPPWTASFWQEASCSWEQWWRRSENPSIGNVC